MVNIIGMSDPWVLRTICSTSAAVLVIVCILWNIHQRRLREAYAVIWLVFGIVLLFFGLFPQIAMYIAKWSGIYYLTVVLGFFIICLFVFILQISILISSHSDSVCTLAQRIAIARGDIQSLKKEIQALQAEIDRFRAKEPPEDSKTEEEK